MDSTIAIGADAEGRAIDLLAARGYRVVERNFRCKLGELDVIAYDGDVLCFVEVRSRSDGSHGGAVEAVDRKKQRQVAKIALFYISLRDPRFERSRFDVVAITGDEVELIQDAWRV
jgi:putative endonuclease